MRQINYRYQTLAFCLSPNINLPNFLRICKHTSSTLYCTKTKKMHKNNYAKMIFIFNVNLMKRTYIITMTAINYISQKKL